MSENNGAPSPADLMLSDAAYDQLLQEAAVDNRLGDHDAIVSKVVVDTWDDGRPRQKVTFTLLTANNAKADLTLSELPTPEQIVAQKDNWDAGRKRGIANSIAIYRQLAQHYGVGRTPVGVANIQEGQRYKVKTGKRTDRNDRSKYFVQVIAFLPKEHAVGSQVAAQSAGPAPAF
jgi:hypothetical protein